MIVVAIDPGERWSGVAVERGNEHVPAITHTMEHERVEDWLCEVLDTCERERAHVVVIIEQFKLYATMAATLINDVMLTSQRIGALRYICRQHDIEPVMQGANLQEPGKGYMRQHGIESVAKTAHERSAEAHLWYWWHRDRTSTAAQR